MTPSDKKRIEYSSNNLGKMFAKFSSFIALCKKGETVFWFARDYIMMDRKSYEAIQKQSAEIWEEAAKIAEGHKENCYSSGLPCGCPRDLANVFRSKGRANGL